MEDAAESPLLKHRTGAPADPGAQKDKQSRSLLDISGKSAYHTNIVTRNRCRPASIKGVS